MLFNRVSSYLTKLFYDSFHLLILVNCVDYGEWSKIVLVPESSFCMELILQICLNNLYRAVLYLVKVNFFLLTNKAGNYYSDCRATVLGSTFGDKWVYRTHHSGLFSDAAGYNCKVHTGLFVFTDQLLHCLPSFSLPCTQQICLTPSRQNSVGDLMVFCLLAVDKNAEKKS